jgi:PhnB protein
MESYFMSQEHNQYSNIIPYLSVSNAIDAMSFYQKVFNATLKEQMPVMEDQAEYFGLPKDTDLTKTTMHASFEINNELLFISDNFSGEVLEKANVSILVVPESLEQMKEFYQKAKDNSCKIEMELEKQFWGDYFTSFTDPFGVRWQMNFSGQDE